MEEGHNVCEQLLLVRRRSILRSTKTLPNQNKTTHTSHREKKPHQPAQCDVATGGVAVVVVVGEGPQRLDPPLAHKGGMMLVHTQWPQGAHTRLGGSMVVFGSGSLGSVRSYVQRTRWG